VVTDIQLLQVALGNLIDNALKYATPASLVQVSASTSTGAHRSPGGILFSVVNTPGPAGLPDASQVFQKYYRSPGARSKTGSGLGLYLVHQIARRLGGWVRYVPGTRQVQFEFWLPG
jgi:signal transduction histidine kinase